MELAEKTFKKVEERNGGKGLEAVGTEGGKEGKSKVITSCRYLEEKLRECSKREGVVMAKGVETLGVGLRTRTRHLGAKEKARRKKVRGEILAHQETWNLPERQKTIGVRKLPSLLPAGAWTGQAVGVAPTERLKLRRLMSAAADKKDSVSLSPISEVNNLEVEEELSTMATLPSLLSLLSSFFFPLSRLLSLLSSRYSL